MARDSGSKRRLFILACGASAALSVAFLVAPDWIERVLGASPDGGDGLTEAMAAIGFFVCAVGAFLALKPVAPTCTPASPDRTST
jgi:hypothetical protein